RSAHPRLLIVRAEHQLPDLCKHDCTRALRARLDCDVERAVGEAIGFERVERPLDGQKLGVIGRILPRHGLVVRLGDHLFATHDDCTNRDFIEGSGTTRLFERRFHAGITTHGLYARTRSRVFSKLSELQSLARSTLMRSPSANSPSSTDTANGFCRNRL